MNRSLLERRLDAVWSGRVHANTNWRQHRLGQREVRRASFHRSNLNSTGAVAIYDGWDGPRLAELARRHLQTEMGNGSSVEVCLQRRSSEDGCCSAELVKATLLMSMKKRLSPNSCGQLALPPKMATPKMMQREKTKTKPVRRLRPTDPTTRNLGCWGRRVLSALACLLSGAAPC